MLNKIEKATEQQNDVAEKLAEERLGFETKLAAKESTIKDWAARQLGEMYKDFDMLLTAKGLDQDMKTKQELGKFKASFAQHQKSDLMISGGSGQL